MTDAVLATYLVEAMHNVTRDPANKILGQIGKLDAPSAACLRQSLRTKIDNEDCMEPVGNGCK